MDFEKQIKADRESLIQDGNQAIAQGGTCLDRSLIQSGLKLQLLPCFIFLVISLQFAPVGQRIVGQFEGIDFARFYFSQRIVAELMCQDGVHYAEEESFLLQHRGDWPPIYCSKQCSCYTRRSLLVGGLRPQAPENQSIAL